MPEVGMRPRHLDGVARTARCHALSRHVEPTEHDGQRVRDLVQRTGQLGLDTTRRIFERSRRDGGAFHA
jgi:hypothetical protein